MRPIFADIVKGTPLAPGEFRWVLLGCAVFLLIVFFVYWLTEKPRPTRSQYTLPTSSASKARVYERPLANPPARVYPKSHTIDDER